MIEFLPQLAFLAIGGSIAPPLLLLTILFLSSRRPLVNATALALGYLAVCAAIGIAGLTVLGEAQDAASAMVRVISVTVGVLLVVLGVKSLLSASAPEAQAPRWMKSINSMSPTRAFGLGMALFPVQIKNLAIFITCVNLIAAASLTPRGSAAALGVVLMVFAAPVLLFIGLYAATPQRSSKALGSFQAWMENNSRAITVVLCFVFGAVFLIRGLSGA